MQKSVALFERYERYVSPVAFIFGFIWDSLTLTRIDLLYDNLVLAFYIMIATAGIVLLHTSYSSKIHIRSLDAFVRWVPLMIQFAFGGMFSGFVVFYLRSSSLAVSWLFLVVLGFFFVGNEFFRGKYHRIEYHLTVLFVALFSFAIFFLPTQIGKIGPSIFLLSGGVSLFLIVLFIFALHSLAPHIIQRGKYRLFYSIGGVFFLMNVFYFTNIIPPIPLSLKEVGVFHYVERDTKGGYMVQYEDAPWYQWYRLSSRDVHVERGDTIYVYTAVFAPTKLSTDIVHHWQKRKESGPGWKSVQRLAYPIAGGRDGGYRGYTLKRDIEPGLWRVDVETRRGQALGRLYFMVEEVGTLPEIEMKTL